MQRGELILDSLNRFAAQRLIKQLSDGRILVEKQIDTLPCHEFQPEKPLGVLFLIDGDNSLMSGSGSLRRSQDDVVFEDRTE